ncbi:MAG: hypothetical protein ACT4NJ_05875 [Nitrosopumilaceae archaeon]
MPSVRCESFNDLLWTYVTETARLRKINRCEALQKIVEEHMKFMAMKQQEMEAKKGAKKKTTK